MTRAREKEDRSASLIERGTTLVVRLRDAFAAHGARNIARQLHKLDRQSRFDWSDL
jgi:hypothetical protein